MKKEEFTTVIDKMKKILDKKGNHLDMSSVIVSDSQNCYKHYFKYEEMCDIRSIAKPIACMAVGIAIEKGLYFDGSKIDLDTYVWPFLSKYSQIKDPQNEEKWREVRLIDLFRITLGHDKGLMFSADVREQDENDLVNYILNYPITGKVGKDFVYSNAGTYLVSSLITEYLGKNLDELVDELLFSQMDISTFQWRKYGKYTAGCTGLMIHNEDLHKFGELLLNNGVYNGIQTVPSHWVEKMRTPQVASPTHRYKASRAFPKWSYGLNLWICEDGNYYCDGSGGQYMIIIPSRNIVITAMGNQSDSEPVSSLFGEWK